MKQRLDTLLVDRGQASTRERAKALIMGGKVTVDGVPVTKAGTPVRTDAAVALCGGEIPYVSRGGIKLEAALESFGIAVEGKSAMDVGSSTGGFTDCMLQRGARRVYCVDVGYGQLAWKLRNDPRVILIERTNIRYLERDRIPEAIDIATIDVSFISLLKVVPKVLGFLAEDGVIIALIKPQFEVGKGEVGKGGIVRDEAKRLKAVDSVRTELESLGLRTEGMIESPLPGQKGNREYLICMRK